MSVAFPVTVDNNYDATPVSALKQSLLAGIQFPLIPALSASASTLSVMQGGSATETITVTDVDGFSGSATLAASGLPSGVTASFATNPTASTSVLTLKASSKATLGSATVTITGTSGSVSATTTIALTVGFSAAQSTKLFHRKAQPPSEALSPSTTSESKP